MDVGIGDKVAVGRAAVDIGIGDIGGIGVVHPMASPIRANIVTSLNNLIFITTSLKHSSLKDKYKLSFVSKNVAEPALSITFVECTIRDQSFAVLLTSQTHADAPMARHSTSSTSNSLPVNHRKDSLSVPIQLQQIGKSDSFPAHNGQVSAM